MKNVNIFWALSPIVLLIGLLSINVIVFSDNATSGPNQIALIFSAMFASVIAINFGYNWKNLQDGIVNSITSAMGAIIILLIIGSLTGTWLIGGIVPAMIYYGIQIIDPSIFLFASCVVCAIIASAIGSSWTTVATIGVALITIGKAIGIPTEISAGAIISGSYFGDKISPLSDTTNLASAMAEVDLIKHIKYMFFTTVPSIIISLILFLILGFKFSGNINSNEINQIIVTIEDNFHIGPELFITPLIMIFLIFKKVPAFPTLFIGTILGGITTILFQEKVIFNISESNALTILTYYKVILQAMFGEINIGGDLLSSNGMYGMLNTIWLIICAMIFGGVMEKAGFLKIIANAIMTRAKSNSSLVTSTAGSCMFFNLTASDQYLAIVVPGRMYKNMFKENKLAPENLSRTLEDTGTVTSVLIPWNTCGAYQAGVLGVATIYYLPYCFFNIISPLMTLLYAYAKIKIKKIN